jgi:hypothetical protein
MGTLQETIAQKFLEELAANQSLDEAKVASLRKLLESGAKLKADDFVKVFTTEGGDVA